MNLVPSKLSPLKFPKNEKLSEDKMEKHLKYVIKSPNSEGHHYPEIESIPGSTML